MKVRATENYQKFKLRDKELKRIPKEGEEFTVTKKRFKELTENKYNVAFIEEIKE